MAVTVTDSYMRPRGAGRDAGAGPSGAGSASRGAWRRNAPGPLVVAVERYELERAEGPNGKPFERATGVYGETTVSHEKVFLRLSTDEEEKQDGGNGVSKMRRALNAIRMGAGEQTVRGRFGELRHPEELAPEDRFLFRCDRVVPIRERGRETTTPDGYTRMRTSWITPVCNYRDKAGNEVRMLDHVETDAFSTVNVGFAGAPEDGTPGYYAAFREAVDRAVDGGTRSMARVAREAAGAVVDLWAARQEAAPGESFGRLSVTTWRPEGCVRVEDASDPAALGRAQEALQAYFSRPAFRPGEGLDNAGEPVLLHPQAAPDCIVRLLDGEGRVCGFLRVNEYRFERAARTAREEGDPEAALALESPEGRAGWLAHCLEHVVPESGRAVGFDILPGECFPVSRQFTQPGAFGSSAQVDASLARAARQLVRLGIEHGHGVCGIARETVGCSPLFVTRTPRDIVNGVTVTKDCDHGHNAVTLAPDGGQLPLDAHMAAAVAAEMAAFMDLPGYRARARAEATDGEAAPGGEQPAAGPGCDCEEIPGGERPRRPSRPAGDDNDNGSSPFPA